MGHVGSAPVRDYDPAYGGVPNVPSTTDTQSSSLSGNLQNLGQLLQLIQGLGSGSQSTLLSNMNAAVPGYSGLTATASGNTQQNLEGKVPDDVVNLLVQQAAERGISTGNPGSANSNAAYLRALGLTSLGQEQTGMQNLSQLTTTAPVVQPINPLSFLVTPDQAQDAQMASNVYASAPVPAAAAAAAKSAARVPSTSNVPWWATGSFASSLGPGTYQSGPGTYHTPYQGFTV